MTSRYVISIRGIRIATALILDTRADVGVRSSLLISKCTPNKYLHDTSSCLPRARRLKPTAKHCDELDLILSVIPSGDICWGA